LFVKPPLSTSGGTNSAAALSELAVVRVDLPCPLGGEDHERVLGIDRCEQVVDLGFDHQVSSGWSGALVAIRPRRDASMIAATSSTAGTTSSFTTT
jgi:hypothetical protein